MQQQRTLIIYTGGTIGMRLSEHGWAPDHQLPQLLLEHELIRENAFDVITLEPLIDSAAMSFQHWQTILNAVAQHYSTKKHNGIIILHGTDTLAHTAAMMSFYLATFPVPIILTGAMRSLHQNSAEAPSDGWQNILLAFSALQQYQQGVYIAFGEHIFHGARVTKFNGNSDHAFSAVNGDRPFQVTTAYQAPSSTALQSLRVMQYTCSPYSNADDALVLTASKPDVLLINVYGSGTAPNMPIFFDRLQAANEQGLISIAMTQCPIGKLDLGLYEASNVVSQSGCLSAQDMTKEAVLAKLFYLHQLPIDTDDKKSRFQQNLIGEC